jgi:hypothetical protein
VVVEKVLILQRLLQEQLILVEEEQVVLIDYLVAMLEHKKVAMVVQELLF